MYLFGIEVGYEFLSEKHELFLEQPCLISQHLVVYNWSFTYLLLLPFPILIKYSAQRDIVSKGL